jgi:hypothetical protein
LKVDFVDKHIRRTKEEADHQLAQELNEQEYAVGILTKRL